MFYPVCTIIGHEEFLHRYLDCQWPGLGAELNSHFSLTKHNLTLLLLTEKRGEGLNFVQKEDYFA